MISISIQCEESEIPAVAQLLGRFGECHHNEKVEPVRALPAGPGAQAQHSEKAHMPREKKAKKLETDTKPPQNDDKVATGDYPANFYEAPIEKLKLSDFEDGKGPLSAVQKQNIIARHGAGETAKAIAVVMGLDGRRVQGVILAHEKAEKRRMAQDAPDSPMAEAKATEEQLPAKAPDQATEAKPDPLHARIIDLDRQKMTPHTISDVLEEELGAVVSEAEIMEVIVRHAKGEL